MLGTAFLCRLSPPLPSAISLTQEVYKPSKAYRLSQASLQNVCKQTQVKLFFFSFFLSLFLSATCMAADSLFGFPNIEECRTKWDLLSILSGWLLVLVLFVAVVLLLLLLLVLVLPRGSPLLRREGRLFSYAVSARSRGRLPRV